MKIPFMAGVLLVQAAMWMIFSVAALYSMTSKWMALATLLLWLVVSSWMISWMHKKAMEYEMNNVVVKRGNSKKSKRL